MKLLCVIPARAGSKRIPRKNRKKFLGKPIIEYPLEQAVLFGRFDKIMILTDDDWILDKYKDYSVKRFNESATDEATLTDAILSIGENKIDKYDYICVMLPTAVFATAAMLETSYQNVKDNSLNGAFSMTKYRHPVQRSFRVNGINAEMVNDYAEFLPTKDLITTYHDAGQFYWLDVPKFIQKKKFFMNNIGYHEIDFAIDIDTLEDWNIAEQYIRGVTP